MPLLPPDEIDRHFNWSPGTAARLARRKKLPHIVLPDGSIRFEWEHIEPLCIRVPAAKETPSAK